METKIQKVRNTISEYERLLSIIGIEAGAICRLSKMEISRLYGKSYTGTLKKLSFLERYGLIENKAGGYVRTEKTVLKDTPMSLIPKILSLVWERPEIFYSFEKQAEILSVPMSDVQTAWGFYSYFFGRKNPGKEEQVDN